VTDTPFWGRNMNSLTNLPTSPITTKSREITDMLQIVDRDLEDARERHISSDWRFGIAYNAALKLCTILLYAEGYRSERALQHYRTIQALPLILGKSRKNDAHPVYQCQSKKKEIFFKGEVFFHLTYPLMGDPNHKERP